MVKTTIIYNYILHIYLTNPNAIAFSLLARTLCADEVHLALKAKDNKAL